MSTRKKTTVVLLGAALGITMAFLVWRAQGRAPGAANAAARPGASAGARPGGRLRPAPLPGRFAAGDPSSMADAPDASGGTVLERFREWSKYPPHSRPLDEAQVDITEPHRIAAGSRRLDRRGADGKEQPTEHACVLQPLRHTVVEGERQQVTLTCQRGLTMEASPTEVPVTVTSVSLRGQNPGRQWIAPPGPEQFNDDGTAGDATAGDLVYTISLGLRPGDWGDMELRVTFQLPELGESLHALSATFTAAGKPPARFTGRFFDRLSGGSLVVDAEISVEKPGRYRIQANLFDAEGPVAVAKNDLRLDRGVARVPLTYFGKIIRDRQTRGPFRVVDLRGYRLNTGLDPEDLLRPPAEVDRLLDTLARTPAAAPEREPIVPWPGEHLTASYDLAAFSDEEWTSEYKTSRLAELARLAEQERAGSAFAGQ